MQRGNLNNRLGNPQRNIANTTNTNTNNLHCKVCEHAGKSAEIVKSHRVKDKDGNVTCPTLLSQECRNCFQPGHTVKYCPILIERNAEEEKEIKRKVKEAEILERTQSQVAAAKEMTKQRLEAAKGRFSALADDSDDERPMQKSVSAPMQKSEPVSAKKAEPVKDLWPELSPNVTLRPHQQHFRTSFASKLMEPVQAKAPAIPYLKKEIPKKTTTETATTAAAALAITDADFDEQAPAVVYWRQFAPGEVNTMNWADVESDSDSDDEEW